MVNKADLLEFMKKNQKILSHAKKHEENKLKPMTGNMNPFAEFVKEIKEISVHADSFSDEDIAKVIKLA